MAPSGMDAHTLAHRLRSHATDLGLVWMGVAPATIPDRDVAAYRRWIQTGHHGEMEYLARPDAMARRAALAETLPGVRSVVMVAEPYPPEDAEGVPEGRIEVEAREWRALLAAARAGGAIRPEVASALEAGLGLIAAISSSDGSLSAPLRFSGGGMFLGPIPLGPAPRF